MIRFVLRLFTLIVPVFLGFTLGVWFEREQMRRECASGSGDWTGTICLNSELLQ